MTTVRWWCTVCGMADKTIPSSIFRVSYATLDEPVAVTVLGRVIGRWVPVGSPVIAPRIPDVGLTAVPPPVVVPELAATPERTIAPDGSVAGDLGREFRPYSKSRQAKGK